MQINGKTLANIFYLMLHTQFCELIRQEARPKQILCLFNYQISAEWARSGETKSALDPIVGEERVSF